MLFDDIGLVFRVPGPLGLAAHGGISSDIQTLCSAQVPNVGLVYAEPVTDPVKVRFARIASEQSVHLFDWHALGLWDEEIDPYQKDEAESCFLGSSQYYLSL